MPILINEAARIRVLRAIFGLCSREFAVLMGVSAATLTAWEKGRNTPRGLARKRLVIFCQQNGIAILPSGMPVPVDDCLQFKEPVNAKGRDTEIRPCG